MIIDFKAKISYFEYNLLCIFLQLLFSFKHCHPTLYHIPNIYRPIHTYIGPFSLTLSPVLLQAKSLHMNDNIVFNDNNNNMKVT